MQTIYRFLKTNRLTQGFGENKACIKVKTTPFGPQVIWPLIVRGKFGSLCLIGYKDFYSWYLNLLGHPGEDWKAYRGEPLYFAADLDTVWWAKSEADIGVRLDVYSAQRVKVEKLPPQVGEEARKEWKNNDGYMYIKFVFAHLKDILWAEEKIKTRKVLDNGEMEEKPIVKFGYQIGWCNNTGASSGDHVHVSMKFVSSKGSTLDRDNKYNGGVSYRECFKFDNIFLGNITNVKEIKDEIKATQYRIIDILKLIIEKLRAEIRKTIGGIIRSN